MSTQSKRYFRRTVTNADVQYALDLAALESTRTARVEKTRGGWQDTGLDLWRICTRPYDWTHHGDTAAASTCTASDQIPLSGSAGRRVWNSVAFKPHKDKNAKGFPTYIKTFTEHSGGERWLEDPRGTELRVVCEGEPR